MFPVFLTAALLRLQYMKMAMASRTTKDPPIAPAAMFSIIHNDELRSTILSSVISKDMSMTSLPHAIIRRTDVCFYGQQDA